jgi:hypothetical protein
MDLQLLSEMTKPNKTFNKWFKRVQDNQTPWTENEIIYFRKYLRANPDKYNVLMDSFKSEYSITPEQTKKGYDYIYNTCFKKNGELRETKDMPFGVLEANVIRNFKEFRFVGLNSIGLLNHDFYLPVYKVIAQDGTYFEYTVNIGQMEVVG